LYTYCYTALYTLLAKQNKILEKLNVKKKFRQINDVKKFSHRSYKNQRLSKKKKSKRKKGKYSRVMYYSLTLPLKKQEKLYKIITIPSVKKVIEKDLKLTISEKSLKNNEKK